MSKVTQLVEKWEGAKGAMSIKDIKDKDIKQNLAILLDNQEKKDLNGQEMFSEASQGAINTGSLGGYTGGVSDTQSYIFRPIALALVRRTFPDLFANKIVGVQAMSTPVGLAYALRCIYDDGTGNEAAWDVVDSYGGYSGNQVGTSGALQTSQDLTSSAVSATKGSGGIYDTSGTGTSTSAGEAWTLQNYCANSESATGCGSYPDLKMRIDQLAITAKTRKLAASFSLEAAQDIKAMHGLEIEREMVNFLQYEITAEMDRELLTAVKNAAVDTTNGGTLIPAIDLTGNTFTGFNGIDGRWSGEKYMNVIAGIIHQANIIATRTRRGPGNFVVVSSAIASMLQAAGHQFVNYSQNVNATQVNASIGRLNGQLEVYRDMYARSDYALVGYKGPGISDAGVIFSPYIMGLTNRAISPSDFSPRVGVMARYAISNSLLGAGRYYRLLSFMNSKNLIPGAGLN